MRNGNRRDGKPVSDSVQEPQNDGQGLDGTITLDSNIYQSLIFLGPGLIRCFDIKTNKPWVRRSVGSN